MSLLSILVVYDGVECLTHLFVGHLLADNQHNGVVSSYSTYDFGQLVIVNVVSQAAGISWTGADDGNVVGEVYGDESCVFHHLVHRAVLLR